MAAPSEALLHTNGPPSDSTSVTIQPDQCQYNPTATTVAAIKKLRQPETVVFNPSTPRANLAPGQQIVCKACFDPISGTYTRLERCQAPLASQPPV